MRTGIAFTVLIMFVSCCCSGTDSVYLTANASGKLTSSQFKMLMETLEVAWNSNDAKRAANCFADDALYSSPPSPRIRRGRQALFEFFGGSRGRPRPMRMQWHHLLFDEDNQIGAGEYTFTYDTRTHGMVIVRIINRRIANWREYEQESPMDWEAFVGVNRF
jgi:SnoaL-like protein